VPIQNDLLPNDAKVLADISHGMLADLPGNPESVFGELIEVSS
jgi:hypothetical protein